MVEHSTENQPTHTVESDLPDLLHSLVGQAVDEGATDIHVDPLPEGARVRFRVDGVIYEKTPLGQEDKEHLINQIKVASDIEIERLFAAAEGQFTWQAGDTSRNLRVTMIPTMHAEAVHLRLLVAPDQWRSVEHLGLSSESLDVVRDALRLPYGLVLISGPTGAGKTTTLYALVSEREIAERLVVSVEDPIEFDFPHVRQMQVDEDAGVTFYQGLRVLLRMDPDVLLVGEVRDEKSAVTAARAAQAGRLVLATLHAHDAAAAIDNMHHLGVPGYVLGDSLRLVIGQNLVRRLCQHCARPRELKPREAALFEKASVSPPEQVLDPVGCEQCHGHGYRGRTGVFEVMVVDDDLAERLTRGTQPQKTRRLEGQTELGFMADALRKVSSGVTSMSEAMRFLIPRPSDDE